MTTVKRSVSMDATLDAMVQAAANVSTNGNTSLWLAKAAVAKLLTDEARELAAHPEYQDTITRHQAEAEAEREQRWAAEDAARGDAA